MIHSLVLIVCGKCKTILGCLSNGDRWYCVICELNRNRSYRSCRWTSYGGKTKQGLNGEPTEEEICFACKHDSQNAKPKIPSIHVRPAFNYFLSDLD